MNKDIKEKGLTFLASGYSQRNWMAWFGCSVSVITIVWNLLLKSSRSSLIESLDHLFWLLYWLKVYCFNLINNNNILTVLKVYPTWDEMANTLKFSPKTLRKKTFLMLAICFEVLQSSKIVCLFKIQLYF
jgi:hypothetical protein